MQVEAMLKRKNGAGRLPIAITVTLSTVCLVAQSGLAQAQFLPSDGQRTPQWFADHPTERAQVRRACLNDLARLGPTADCVNANRGDATELLRQGNAGQDANDPTSPAYWTQRPSNRTVKLTYCNRMPPEQQFRANCGPAQESLRQQQRGTRQ